MTLTQKKEGFYASIDTTNWTSKNGFAAVLTGVMDKNLKKDMNTLKDECIGKPLFKHTTMGNLLSLRGEVVIEEETNGYGQLSLLFNHKKQQLFTFGMLFLKKHN